MAGDGADFLLSEVTEALKLMKTESSLLTYLDSLLDLRGSPYLYTTKRATRLNLQVGQLAPLCFACTERLQSLIFKSKSGHM